MMNIILFSKNFLIFKLEQVVGRTGKKRLFFGHFSSRWKNFGEHKKKSEKKKQLEFLLKEYLTRIFHLFT